MKACYRPLGSLKALLTPDYNPDRPLATLNHSEARNVAAGAWDRSTRKIALRLLDTLTTRCAWVTGGVQ